MRYLVERHRYWVMRCLIDGKTFTVDDKMLGRWENMCDDDEMLSGYKNMRVDNVEREKPGLGPGKLY